MADYVVILVAVASFAVTATVGKFLIPFLRRLKFGQNILTDIGPKWHEAKQGTPTMGGFMFIIGIFVAITLGFSTYGIQYGVLPANWAKIVLGFLMALALGMIGFVDDFISVTKKRNMGLSSKQKFLLQCLVAVLYLAGLYAVGDTSTILIIPFIGQINLGFFYYPVMVVFIVGVSNAVNITDGVDGLSSSVTFTCAIGFLVISGILGLVANSIMAAALAGGMIGYLIYNFYPAKVFMGDTGSLFMSGMVISLSFNAGMPILLILCGIIYFIEVFSVMLQIASVKTRGKRIFKMSPIHHHFEMSDWSEVKIVTSFALFNLLGSVLAIISVILLIN